MQLLALLESLCEPLIQAALANEVVNHSGDTARIVLDVLKAEEAFRPQQAANRGAGARIGRMDRLAGLDGTPDATQHLLLVEHLMHNDHGHITRQRKRHRTQHHVKALQHILPHL